MGESVSEPETSEAVENCLKWVAWVRVLESDGSGGFLSELAVTRVMYKDFFVWLEWATGPQAGAILFPMLRGRGFEIERQMLKWSRAEQVTSLLRYFEREGGGHPVPFVRGFNRQGHSDLMRMFEEGFDEWGVLVL